MTGILTGILQPSSPVLFFPSSLKQNKRQSHHRKKKNKKKTEASVISVETDNV